LTGSGAPDLRKPLRLWPGVVAVALLWLARFGIKAAVPGFQGFARGMMGGILAAAVVVLWWLFFSRAAWLERLGALFLMIVAMGATWQFRHESMGPLWAVGYALPVLMLAFVVWAVATRRLPDGLRRTTMAATILVACGAWTLVRTEGINGDHVAEFGWRWARSAEERLLARTGVEPAAITSVPTPATARTVGDWPGFRGPDRDGNVPGTRIATDWSRSPPVELWRQPIGPGWSSFAVHGDLLYTQEQRGPEEVVTCYRTTTGEPEWTHGDEARFFESNAGPGPRGTPTLSDGRVYTLGATGFLNALDAQTGAVAWSRNVASDSGAAVADPPAKRGLSRVDASDLGEDSRSTRTRR